MILSWVPFKYLIFSGFLERNYVVSYYHFFKWISMSFLFAYFRVLEKTTNSHLGERSSSQMRFIFVY